MRNSTKRAWSPPDTPDNTLNPTVGHSFFQPLHDALAVCYHTRVRPTLADADWLVGCVRRILSQSKTGPQRFRLLEEINQALRQPHSQHLPDQQWADPRLEAFDFYAGDGHWHAAAVHDPVHEGTKFATGHLFGLDLRTHRAFHLTVADQLNRRKEHDMRGLKRAEVEALRQGAPKGRKVLWVWGRRCRVGDGPGRDCSGW